MKNIDIHMHVPPNDVTFEKELKIMDRHDVAAGARSEGWERS